jgi:hypothetical protein|tara:strand:+ start:1969 stop:2172 length:204 start_codon:yes stop_codon:yes gene_type:complete
MKQKLTSVKVDIDSWDSFRKLSIDEKITFRELVKISLIEFINDKVYRKTIKEKVIENGKKENTITRR